MDISIFVKMAERFSFKTIAIEKKKNKSDFHKKIFKNMTELMTKFPGSNKENVQKQRK